MARLNMNLDDVKDEDIGKGGGWKAIPEGEYRCMIADTAYKPTKAGNGMCLHLPIIVCDQGPYDGKEVRDYLTLEHPNPDTVKIAKAKLKEIAIAIGHETPNRISDSKELEAEPFLCVIGQEEASDPKYGDSNGMQNKVWGYKPLAATQADLMPQASAQEPAHLQAPPPPMDDSKIPF